MSRFIPAYALFSKYVVDTSGIKCFYFYIRTVINILRLQLLDLKYCKHEPCYVIGNHCTDRTVELDRRSRLARKLQLRLVMHEYFQPNLCSFESLFRSDSVFDIAQFYRRNKEAITDIKLVSGYLIYFGRLLLTRCSSRL